MTILAIVAASLAIGTWLGIRIADASQRIDRDLATYLLSIPADEWQEKK